MHPYTQTKHTHTHTRTRTCYILSLSYIRAELVCIPGIRQSAYYGMCSTDLYLPRYPLYASHIHHTQIRYAVNGSVY